MRKKVMDKEKKERERERERKREEERRTQKYPESERVTEKDRKSQKKVMFKYVLGRKVRLESKQARRQTLLIIFLPKTNISIISEKKVFTAKKNQLILTFS